MTTSHIIASKLILTKLSRPVPNSKLVHRPRLIEILRMGMNRKLTYLIAPAGFGKTTLLSEWASSMESMRSPVAWISLDEGDNEPGRFWEYFITALEQIQPDIKDLLSGVGRQDYENSDPSFTTLLINAISLLTDQFNLILDDFHMIDNEVIHDRLSDLLRYLPPNMHLVIASRKEPPLSIARLRTKNDIVELRYDDLKFTTSETNTFLSQIMGINLPSYYVNRLNHLTEGWITGLVLAAPALKHLHTPNEIDYFIANFGGGFQHILNYLTIEVLDHLSPAQKEFLLKTSILPELNISLCNAILGINNSQIILNDLEQANLFLQPVSEQRQEYRFHSLFINILQAHLKKNYSKEEIDKLNLAACEWYRTQVDVSQAIPFAVACGKEDLAAEIIEDFLTDPCSNYDSTSTILEWFKPLPPAVLNRHPNLRLYWAIFSLIHGYPEKTESILKDIEQFIRENPSYYPNINQIQNSVSAIRAATRCVVGYDCDSISLAEEVLKSLDDTIYTPKVILEYYLTLAYQAFGDLTFEINELITMNQEMYRRQESNNYLSYQALLATIYEQRGQLYLAAEAYQQAIDYIHSRNMDNHLTSLVIEMGLSDVYREWNDLKTADRLAAKAKEEFLQYKNGEPCWLHSTKTLLLLARNSISNHRYKEAREYLDIATRRAQTNNSIPSLLASVEEVRVRYWLAINDLRKATAWARNKKMLHANVKPGEFQMERLQIARISVAENHPEEALEWLNILIPDLEKGNQGKLLFEAHILKALAFWQNDQHKEAINLIHHILPEAEHENYIRTWVELHPLVEQLLAAAIHDHANLSHGTTNHSALKDYLQHLISAFHEAQPKETIPVESGKVVDLTFEQLTDREQEVLHLLASGCSTSRIAQSLTISTSTAKTHIRNIYQKLGVNSRSYALERARDLGLISPFQQPSPINE